MSAVNTVKAFAVNAVLKMFIDVLSDMSSKEGVTKFRDKVITLGETLTGKTETEFDDNCWEYVATKILTPAGWNEHGKEFIIWAKEYVMDSATKYDDYILPILIALEEAFNEE